MFGLGTRKKDDVVQRVEVLRMARSYFGMATHLRRNSDREALCGSELLDDDSEKFLSGEELESLVLNNQHSNFFFCGGCISLELPDFSEEEVYSLRK